MAQSICSKRVKIAVLATVMFASRMRADGAVLLGLHEALVLVEHTPVFLRAVEKGQCPQDSDSVLNGFVATVIVRGGCKRFDWIAGLDVDVRTGTITRDGGPSGPIEIETQELAELREKLFALRAAARLTPSEARCLLDQTPPAVQIKDSCRHVRIISEDDLLFSGAVEDSCLEGAEHTNIRLIVDRYSGAVADGRTGNPYTSTLLDSLRQDLVRVHSPVRLTVDDARRLAENSSVFPESKDVKCAKVVQNPDYNADEVWLQLSRGCGAQTTVTVISVDVRTGVVRIVGPNTMVDSPAVRRIRETMLAEARMRNTAAAERLLKACR